MGRFERAGATPTWRDEKRRWELCLRMDARGGWRPRVGESRGGMIGILDGKSKHGLCRRRPRNKPRTCEVHRLSARGFIALRACRLYCIRDALSRK